MAHQPPPGGAPAQGYAPQQPAGYPPHAAPPDAGYPPPQQQHGYGYPPPPAPAAYPAYGGGHAPPQYHYPQQQQQQQQQQYQAAPAGYGQPPAPAQHYHTYAAPAAAAPPAAGLPAWQQEAAKAALGAMTRAPAPAPAPAAWGGAYNAVPPPPMLSAARAPRGGRPAAIRPQVGGRTVSSFGGRALEPTGANATPVAWRPMAPAAAPPATAAAAAAAAHQPPPARPAYLSVAPPPPAPAPAPAAAPPPPGAAPPPPAQWPPALRTYVERAFIAVAAADRTKLQQALKGVVADAFAKGELWTRDWGALPRPDLSGSAADAVARVAAAAAAAAAPPPAAGRLAAHALFSAQQHQQQHQAPPQQTYEEYQAQQAARARGKAKPPKQPKGRKRRAAAGGPDADEPPPAPPPQLTAAERARLRRRAGRFGDGAADGAAPGAPAEAARRRRIAAALEADAGAGAGGERDWDAYAIRGTATALEKSYFRLTSAPDASTVRPAPVLGAALARLVGLLARREAGYFYASDQLKGMRQDLTVQHLRGRLAAAVYEAHARAALEYGDVAEYNQCQARLAVLYGREPAAAEGTPGAAAEMLALRLLYQAAHAAAGEQLALLHTLRAVAGGGGGAPPPAVRHALAARAALAAGDARRFFALYACAPGLGRALLDVAAPGVRFGALAAAAAAFRPPLPLAAAARMLGFHIARAEVAAAAAAAGLPADGPPPAAPLPGCIEPRFEGRHAPAADAAAAEAACAAWLAECGAVLVADAGGGLALDGKASAAAIRMPEDREAVAHGDANLHLGDFLKSF